jgi:hypothetical protein
VVATEDDKLLTVVDIPLVVVATEEDKFPIEELRSLSIVANDELNPNVVTATDPLSESTEELIDVLIELLNVEYPVVPVILICDEPETTVSEFSLFLIVVAIDEVKLFKLPVEVSILPNLLFCVLSIDATEDDRLPIEELRLLVVVATEPDNEPIEELRLFVVVATEPLKSPMDVDTDELNVLYPVTPVKST